MKTIDLNFDIKDLEERLVGNASQIVATLLMSEVKGDAIKYFDWATTLNKKEPISVDDSDLSKIKELLKSTEKMSFLIKVPIIRHLEKIK